MPHAGKSCPSCLAPLAPEQPLAGCPQCGAPHHAECWERNQGCTAPGCQGTRAGGKPVLPVQAAPRGNGQGPPGGAEVKGAHDWKAIRREMFSWNGYVWIVLVIVIFYYFYFYRYNF